MDLHIQRWGEQGSEVLFVHGSVMNGEMTWAEQRPLAERWRLLVLDRRGYFPTHRSTTRTSPRTPPWWPSSSARGCTSSATPTAPSSHCSPPPSGPRRCAR